MLGHPVKVNVLDVLRNVKLVNVLDVLRNVKQTNRWNHTNFERKLAMMVIYLPVKF